MNVVDALVAHHAVLRELFTQSDADPKAFEEYIRHLDVHHRMEEKYFYDFLEKVVAARHDALEGVNEHHIIEMIILDSKRFPRDHERFAVKVEGLGEYTNHHLEEEETRIFPLAQQHLPADVLDTLGTLFVQAKETLLAITLPAAPQAAESPPKSEPEGPSTPVGPPGFGLGIGSLKK
jgi:hemerythrin-like domain-containing protein